MKKTKTILWGSLLVVVGLLFSLKALDLVDFNIFFRGWWTLFIIIPCTVGLFTERDKTGNLIGIAIGGVLLLASRDVIGFGMLWKLLIPVVILIVGLKMIFGGFFGGKISKAIANIETNSEGFRNSYAAFAGNTMVVDGEVFEGAEFNAIFGGIECDLRNAIIEKDCVIKVCAIFGGIDILVSEKVNVVIDSTSIFGGMGNKTPGRKDVPTVYVSGTCMFGGVEVK